MVGPIWDSVRIGEGRDACQIFSGNDLASRPELGEDLGHAHSILHQHRVGEQAQTAHFVHNLLVVTRAKHSLIRKEEPTRQPMAGFPAVELQLDTPPKLPLLNEAGGFSVFAILLGIAGTTVYLAGLILRGNYSILGMGLDSFIVLLLYAGG